MDKRWFALVLRAAVALTLVTILAAPASANFRPASSGQSDPPLASAATLEWTQRTTVSAPSPRIGAVTVFDSARDVTVLFGGYNGSDLGDTWEYDGTDWTQRTPATAPSARYNHAMAYDSARGVTVLFGGGSDLGDTWEYDGVSWTQRSPAVSPDGRAGHTMVYDPARGVTVLFGGASGVSVYTYHDDVWEWDGTNWTQRTPTVSPPGRAGAAMAHDNLRHVTVLFGGYGYAGFVGDTWEWDGTDWTQRAPSLSPSPRHSASMVYDSARGMCILFGGYDFSSGDFNDTWAWDGSAWALQTLSASPPARERHAMAYDTARGVTVLYGGIGALWYADTWELGPVTYRVYLPLVVR